MSNRIQTIVSNYAVNYAHGISFPLHRGLQKSLGKSSWAWIIFATDLLRSANVNTENDYAATTPACFSACKKKKLTHWYFFLKITFSRSRLSDVGLHLIPPLVPFSHRSHLIWSTLKSEIAHHLLIIFASSCLPMESTQSLSLLIWHFPIHLDVWPVLFQCM